MIPRFSIIIPVYNIERYINECVDSVLSQSYGNFEIILVDDGSTDKCPELCNEYERKDNRVKVIHKNNGGLSDARNAGMGVANGEYIMFIDGDDFIGDMNALKKINIKINEEKPDILVYGVKKMFEKTHNYIEGKKLQSNIIQKNVVESCIQENFFKACAWDKVIKHSVIKQNSLEFPKKMYSEDITWCACLLKYCNRYSVLNENIYVYRQRNGSITKSVGLKNIEDIVNQIDKFANENNEIVLNYLAYEYSVVLGLVKTKAIKVLPKEDRHAVEQKIFNLRWLLNYKMSDKVKKVNILSKFVGIKITSLMLGYFIDLKRF